MYESNTLMLATAEANAVFSTVFVIVLTTDNISAFYTIVQVLFNRVPL